MTAKVVSLVHGVRRLRGSSRPILAMADDGALYVVKMYSGTSAASAALFHEAAGSVLYRALGLLVPEWQPVYVSAKFLDQNRASDFQSAEQESKTPVGLAFGSRSVSGPESGATDILASASYNRLIQRELFWLAWLVDSNANHSDNRQAVFVRNQDGSFHATFIDHGRMFGGLSGLDRPKVVASRYLDPRIYPDFSDSILHMIEDRLSRLRAEDCEDQVGKFPEAWVTTGALQTFSATLSRLSDRKIWENVLHTMIAGLARSKHLHEADSAPTGPRPTLGVLHS